MAEYEAVMGLLSLGRRRSRDSWDRGQPSTAGGAAANPGRPTTPPPPPSRPQLGHSRSQSHPVPATYPFVPTGNGEKVTYPPPEEPTTPTSRKRKANDPERSTTPEPAMGSSTASSPSKRKPYECQSCGRAFTRREHLFRHIETTHYNQKDFQCSVCFRVFSRKDNMMQHARNKHNQYVKPKKEPVTG